MQETSNKQKKSQKTVYRFPCFDAEYTLIAAAMGYLKQEKHKKKSLILNESRTFKRCVRDSNSSRNPFCTNILFNQVFKVQRLIQREEFAVLLSFDRLNWNNAKIVKNNNMTKFRYITHCFFEVFVLS